jgi:hypothetical protein
MQQQLLRQQERQRLRHKEMAAEVEVETPKALVILGRLQQLFMEH